MDVPMEEVRAEAAGDHNTAGPPVGFAGHEDVASFVNVLLSHLTEGTSAFDALPVQDDHRYHSTFRAFPREMAEYSAGLLHLLQETSKITLKKPLTLPEGADPDAAMEAMTELVDGLLESVDRTLDELKEPKDKATAKTREYQSQLRGVGGALRPQLLFDPPLDNSTAPFRVKIYKNGKLSYGEPGVHLFEQQILAFAPTPKQLECRQEQLYGPLDATPLHWVDTLEKLQEMERTLSAAPEVAVDIEAHDYHSFQGFICLLQFSTRDHDFLVDALELRDHLHCLNGFFTNPAITKIMHGAQHDVVWLQRDFGIYIVNLFDTFCAAKVLDFPSLGLAHLLAYFCDVKANKQYQLADWRVRPLSSELLKYAREDTHYLLYIHDRLKVLLSNTIGTSGAFSGLEECYRMSQVVCLRRYEKTLLTEIEVQRFLTKKAPGLTRTQEAVVRALLYWRETTARTEDESIGFVLPTAMLIKIARDPPTTVRQLFGSCHPLPVLLRRDGKAVMELIQKAIQSADGGSAAPPAAPLTAAAATAAASPDEPESPRHSPEPCDAFAPDIPDPSDEPGCPSPVLTTDQLYQEAGWVEAVQLSTENAPPPAAVRPTALTVTPVVRSANLQSHRDPVAGRYVPRAAATAAVEGRSSLFSALTAVSTTPAPKIDFSKLFADVAAEPPAAKVGGGFLSAEPQPAPAEPTPNIVADASEEDPPQPTPSNTMGEDGVKNAKSTEVPRSLYEIYKLSAKKARRRAKHKAQPAAGVDGAPTEPHDDQMDADDSTPAAPAQSAAEFMAEIGWVADPTALPTLPQPTAANGTPASSKPTDGVTDTATCPPHAPQPQRPPSTGSRPCPSAPRLPKKPFAGGGRSGFVPYDYSKAPDPFGQHGQRK